MTSDKTKIGDESWVSMALFRTVVLGVVGAFISIIGAIFWAASVDAKLEQAVQTSKQAVIVQSSQSADIAAIRDSMVLMSTNIRDVQRDLADRWKLSDQMWWASELQRLNPTMGVPDLGKSPGQVR